MARKNIIDKYYLRSDGNGGNELHWRLIASDVMKAVIVLLSIAIVKGGWGMYNNTQQALANIKTLQIDQYDIRRRHENLIKSTSQLAMDVSTINGKLDIIIRRLP